jgi:RNA polymerase sigma-70 factor (ECF subfamily)
LASQEFEANLVAILPKMRAWAAGLTRNRSEVDDLVQETALKALAACYQFLSGTNFMAWVHRIMVNQFISGKRKQRLFTDLLPEQSVSATHLDQIELRELARAIDRLPRAQRIALSAKVLAEKSYDELAVETGCPAGTLKSRVHRARAQLRLSPWPAEGRRGKVTEAIAPLNVRLAFLDASRSEACSTEGAATRQSS